MRRFSVLLAAVVVSLLAVPTRADAWYEWLEKLSGPGPFKGWQVEVRVWCVGDYQERDRTDSIQTAATQMDVVLQSLNAARQQLYAHALPKPDSPDPSIRELLKDEANRLSVYRSAFLRVDDLINSVAGIRAQIWSAQNGSNAQTARGLAKLIEPLKKVEESVSAFCGPADGCGTSSAALSAAEASLKSVKEQLTNLGDQSKDGRFYGGGSFSICPPDQDRYRQASFDVVVGRLSTFGGANEAYAGNHRIVLSTLMPTVTWRPLAGNKYYLDWFDLAAGAGFYAFSTGGDFDPLSGLMLQPIRLDLHAPSRLPKGLGALSIISYRRGLTVFAKGFKANAFGTHNGVPSERLEAEWIKSKAIFVDLSSLLHFRKK